MLSVTAKHCRDNDRNDRYCERSDETPECARSTSSLRELGIVTVVSSAFSGDRFQEWHCLLLQFARHWAGHSHEDVGNCVYEIVDPGEFSAWDLSVRSLTEFDLPGDCLAHKADRDALPVGYWTFRDEGSLDVLVSLPDLEELVPRGYCHAPDFGKSPQKLRKRVGIGEVEGLSHLPVFHVVPPLDLDDWIRRGSYLAPCEKAIGTVPGRVRESVEPLCCHASNHTSTKKMPGAVTPGQNNR